MSWSPAGQVRPVCLQRWFGLMLAGHTAAAASREPGALCYCHEVRGGTEREGPAGGFQLGLAASHHGGISASADQGGKEGILDKGAAGTDGGSKWVLGKVKRSLGERWDSREQTTKALPTRPRGRRRLGTSREFC